MDNFLTKLYYERFLNNRERTQVDETTTGKIHKVVKWTM